jgi:hypothetical protein
MEGKMKKLRFSRPSPAMVIACLALFVALGGTAAAVKIGSSKIKKGAVKRSKIHDDAVNTAKLANGAVTKDQLAKHAVSSSKLGQGSVKGGKIADGAVTGDKVEDGSLNLAKVAQLVVDASPDPPSIPAGACAAAPNVSTAGIQPGDSLLVLPRPDSNSAPNLAPLAAQSNPVGASVKVVFCNSSGAPIDGGPQRVKIAIFH